MAFLRFGLIMAAVFFALVMCFGLLRFSIEVGESPARYVVQDVGVFLAGVMGLSGCWMFLRRLKARHDALFLNPPPFTGNVFEARVWQYAQLLAVAVFGILGIIGLAWLAHKAIVGPGALVALMLLASIPALAWANSMYRNGDPTLLRMDTQGLDHPWYGHIQWAEVAGMNFQEIESGAGWIFTMVLGVNAPDRFYDRMPWITRFMQNRWPSTGLPFGELRIPLNPLDKPPREIYAAAWALRHRVQPPLNSLWQASPF